MNEFKKGYRWKMGKHYPEKPIRQSVGVGCLVCTKPGHVRARTELKPSSSLSISLLFPPTSMSQHTQQQSGNIQSAPPPHFIPEEHQWVPPIEDSPSEIKTKVELPRLKGEREEKLYILVRFSAQSLD